MRIVLREDVDTLGRKGDLVDVADGYARNYLVPKGLAMKATKGVVAQAESMRRSREVKETRDRDAAQALAAQLGSRALEIKARAGEGGKLFGSVTAKEIGAALARRGIAVDRHKIELEDPLKQLGTYKVAVRIHPGLEPAEVTVVVEPKG
jgi:large subunit ribosomal protein L9